MKIILLVLFVISTLAAQFPTNLVVEYESGGNALLSWEIEPDIDLLQYYIHRDGELLETLVPSNPIESITEYLDYSIPCLDSETPFIYEVGVEYLDGSIGFSQSADINIYSSNNCIFVENSTGPALTSIPVLINMTNEDELYGFQFNLEVLDTPVMLDSISTTGRTAEYMLSAQQLESGSILILGFNLQGFPILGSEGPIVEVWLTGQQSGITDACLRNVMVSHPAGMPWAHAECGVISFSCGTGIGDLNQDSIIDILDIVSVVNCIMDEDECWCADMDENWVVDVSDIVQLVQLILGGI